MCLQTSPWHFGRMYPHYFHVTYHVTKGESSPHMTTDICYGHETPFSIKLSQVRELTRSRSRDDITTMTPNDIDAVVEEHAASGNKCEFYLKHKKTPKKHNLDDSSYQKSTKKSKKSPNIISNLFRKIRSPHPLVFGLPLSEICDENCDPPESIIRLMVLVYRKGPTVPGILRRGSKASLAKEIREKIDSGVRFTLDDHQAPTAASVFKEFLRCVPGGLLVDELHDQWVTVNKDDPPTVKLDKIKSILAQLPPAHLRLVKLTVCLLQHLAKHSEHTHMGPGNLATCIAPSFWSSSSTSIQGTSGKDGSNAGGNSAATLLHVQNSVREITTVFTPLISFMIVKHVELFSADILGLFVKHGCEASPSMSLEEMGDEGGVDGVADNGTGAEDDVDDRNCASDNIGDTVGRRESSMGDADEVEEDEDDEDDDMMVEDDDEDYDGNFRRHQAHLQLRHQHPHHQHLPQHQTANRQRTQPGPRDSNSGTDSDSMHSVLSMPDTGSGMGYRRDDSSLDSLVEREYFQIEDSGPGCSPKSHHKSHLSPSNLSRDSGLTLSDTQLYDEDPGTTSGEMTTAQHQSSRFFGRSASSNYELEPHQSRGDEWLTKSMVDTRSMDRRGGSEPVPPPRYGREYNKKKPREFSEGSEDGDFGGYRGDFSPGSSSSHQRPPFIHSASTTLLDIGGNKNNEPSLKPSLTHPPIGQRLSSDSIGEEGEYYDPHNHHMYHPHHPYYNQRQQTQPHSSSRHKAIDFRNIRLGSDMGTIVKSDSGTHLFLDEDAVHSRYNLSQGGKASPPAVPQGSQTSQSRGVLLRQASLTDSITSLGTSTPPMSPLVRDEFDSPLAKTQKSQPPMTENLQSNEEQMRKSKPWEPKMNSAYREWDGELNQNLNSHTLSSAFSKSTSDLLMQIPSDDEDLGEEQDKTITADNSPNKISATQSPDIHSGPTRNSPPSSRNTPPSPKVWHGSRKSHEAEEISDMRKRPHFSLMIRHESGDHTSQQPPPYRKQSLGLPSKNLMYSPPPNVILQSLSGPLRKDIPASTLSPLRASYDTAILSQVRRSSAIEQPTKSALNISESMNSIKPEEYLTVTPKSIMIHSPSKTNEECVQSNSIHPSPPSSSTSLASSTKSSLSPMSSANVRRAKLAKYMSSIEHTIQPSNTSLDDTSRPEKPPNYHQALQRNFMIKHSVPIDITDDDTERQREKNAKAKALYEQSLQLYNEQRVYKVQDSNASSSVQDYENNKAKTQLNKQYNFRSDSSTPHSSFDKSNRKISLHGSPPNQTEQNFLDLGSISHSLQADIVSLRDKHNPTTSFNTNKSNTTAQTLPTYENTHSQASSISSSSISPNSCTSLSRHNSHLSDISGSSSGGSTITISTVGRPSDTSIGSRASMASNSSISGAESSTESPAKVNSVSDLNISRMGYSRHFRSQDLNDNNNIQPVEDYTKDGSKSLDLSNEKEGVYVTLKKNPQQLYLESRKIYEQKVVPSTDTLHHEKPKSSPSSGCVNSSKPAQVVPPHQLNPSNQHSFQTSLISSKTSSPAEADSNTNSKDNRRPKSLHECSPGSGLHRSQSDVSINLAKVAAKFGPRVKAAIPSHRHSLVEEDVSEQKQGPQPEQQQPNLDSVPSSSLPGYPSDITPEHHQNFLKARSCFYNTEVQDNIRQNSPRPSSKTSIIRGGRSNQPLSTIPSSSTFSSLSSYSVSTSNLSTLNNRPYPPPLPEDLSVESGHSPRSKSHVPVKPKTPRTFTPSTSSPSKSQTPSPSQVPPLPISSPALPASSKQSASNTHTQDKRELPWSVKSLKSLYDTEQTGNSNDKTGPSPPPYQDPPPFRRQQGAARASTSSSSSAGSEVFQGNNNIRKTSLGTPRSGFRTGGPQNVSVNGVSDWSYGSLSSSSEDGYNSSLERRARTSLDSSEEAISDNTNITYV